LHAQRYRVQGRRTIQAQGSSNFFAGSSQKKVLYYFNAGIILGVDLSRVVTKWGKTGKKKDLATAREREKRGRQWIESEREKGGRG